MTDTLTSGMILCTAIQQQFWTDGTWNEIYDTQSETMIRAITSANGLSYTKGLLTHRTSTWDTTGRSGTYWTRTHFTISGSGGSSSSGSGGSGGGGGGSVRKLLLLNYFYDFELDSK